MLTSKYILTILNDNMDKIEEFGVSKIGLFGSYTRDAQLDDSDIDILVEFQKAKKTFDNYMGLKFFLEDLFNKDVDLVISENIKLDLRTNILGSVKYARV